MAGSSSWSTRAPDRSAGAAVGVLGCQPEADALRELPRRRLGRAARAQKLRGRHVPLLPAEEHLHPPDGVNAVPHAEALLEPAPLLVPGDEPRSELVALQRIESLPEAQRGRADERKPTPAPHLTPHPGPHPEVPA